MNYLLHSQQLFNNAENPYENYRKKNWWTIDYWIIFATDPHGIHADRAYAWFMIKDNQLLLHRDNDLPALIYYDKNKNYISRSWYQNNKLHRKNAPAYVSVNEQSWHENGLEHRIDGPSFIQKNPDCQAWRQYNVLHRIDGPTIIYGTVCNYYINGKYYENFTDYLEAAKKWIRRKNRVKPVKHH